MSFLRVQRPCSSLKYRVTTVQKGDKGTYPYLRKCGYSSALIPMPRMSYNLTITRSFHMGHAKFTSNKENSKDDDSIEVPSITSLSDESFKDFLAAFEKIREDVAKKEKHPVSLASEWCSEVLDYNVSGGKIIRGLNLIEAYKLLMEPHTTKDGLISAYQLGWCVEMLHAFFLINDDIMDRAVMRRGKECWYRKPSVGLAAVNDSLLIQSALYDTLEDNFGNTPLYPRLLNAFLKETRNTVYGQCLDSFCSPYAKQPRFELFNMKMYNSIVEYKTAHYTYCLPLHLAMHLADNCLDVDFTGVEPICIEIGRLFQVQDDFLDCYGDPGTTGKFGSDIAEGKCTWFAVTLLEQAQSHELEEMKKNYGVNSEEAILKVLKLYDHYRLKEQYHAFEEKLHGDIFTLICDDVKNETLQEILTDLIRRIYKRKH